MEGVQLLVKTQLRIIHGPCLHILLLVHGPPTADLSLILSLLEKKGVKGLFLVSKVNEIKLKERKRLYNTARPDRQILLFLVTTASVNSQNLVHETLTHL